MDLDGEVCLSALFRRVPHLLNACVCEDDHDAALYTLRLVNKEASQVALRALKVYYLDLRGAPSDSIIAGATLLQSTRLHTFKVFLQLSGRHSWDCGKPDCQLRCIARLAYADGCTDTPRGTGAQ